MAYFKVILEEGRKKRAERTIYMQGNDFCDTVLGNMKRFRHARLLDAYHITREEYLIAVANKE